MKNSVILMRLLIEAHDRLSQFTHTDDDGSLDKLLGEIKSSLEIRHTHIANRNDAGKLLDSCKHCGRDIREKIHLRQNEK